MTRVLRTARRARCARDGAVAGRAPVERDVGVHPSGLAAGGAPVRSVHPAPAAARIAVAAGALDPGAVALETIVGSFTAARPQPAPIADLARPTGNRVLHARPA